MISDQTDAFVIRSVDFSETSKVVTLFSRDLGKLSVMAKGARRLKSSFEVALDLLSVCRICVRRKTTAELDLLTEAKLLERFDGLRRNLGALYAGYFIAEVLNGLTGRHDAHPVLYDSSVETLRRLGQGEDRQLTLIRFQLKLLKELGYAPILTHCSISGAEVGLSERMAYSVAAGGLVHPDEARNRSGCMTIQGATVQALRVYSGETEAAERLVPSQRGRDEMWRLLLATVATHLGRMPKMVAMLDAS
ncbi:DNA repair protein RecO [Planctomycetes bacterium Pan216]|uniref:DNA repair protein RecO n=1 Tax=Kolteria novifilia TaxID=2527975 RepID=A0A518B876_9BACT|nr:DNA repair protein RecO [Planctomycetes bacterium Pan216]